MTFVCFEEMAKHPRPDTKNQVFYASLRLKGQIHRFYQRFRVFQLAKLGGGQNPHILRPWEPPKSTPGRSWPNMAEI